MCVASVFYRSGGVVFVQGEDPQRLALLVRRRGAHCGDDAFVQRLLELGPVEALHQNTDRDAGGGKLITVPHLSSLGENDAVGVTRV